MRFAGNTSNTNSFIAAGKAAAQGAENLFRVARENSPDYGMLANENMKNRSKERQVATAAEAAVRREGMKAITQVKKTGIKVDANEKILDTKLDAKRKAGFVGALGAIAGGGLMAVENNRAKKLQAERDAKEEARETERLELMSSILKPDGPSYYDLWKKDNPEPEPYKPDSSGSGTSSGSASSLTSAPVASKPPTVAKVTAPASRQAAFNEIYELAKKVGGTKFPEVVAAQSMHETGWLAAPNSVYKSTGGTNPFGQTGDRGYGTIPRKGFKDGWTLYPDKETAVRDHIKLWHDTGNHSGNYNAFDTIRDGVASVAPAYSPNSDPENIRKGYTVDGYSKGVRSASTIEMADIRSKY